MTTLTIGSENIFEDEFGDFADEVLNAGWTPPLAEVLAQAAASSEKTTVAGTPALDVDAFLSRVYQSQGE